MEFDWARAIEKNREQLLDVVTQMFILAGIRTGRVVEMLPHGLRLRILALLRPAEFATRRLIAMAACKLVTVVVRSLEKHEARPQHSVILGLEPRTHSVKPETSTDDRKKLPAFPLFNPFKPFGHPWLEAADAGNDTEWSPQFYTPPNEPVDAQALCRRIRALEQALQDLEKHAARLARWRARRRAEIAARAEASSQPPRARVRPGRFSPMRPGHPPGWRKRPKTQIEGVLRECNFLAHDAWDTS